MDKSIEKKFMSMAISLAFKGEGLVSPNPMVGAVIVKSGKILSKGYHHYFGARHAEIDALKKVKFKAKGATLFVNLEPCCHFGKTPPCTDAIIKSGIKSVVIGTKDPNPLVAGKGIRVLKRAGIKVRVGILSDECKRLNENFIKSVTKKIPFVTVKIASSIDGKIALANGESKWITGKKARLFVHEKRNLVDAILVGSKTVIKDNPSLNVRGVEKFIKNPLRVILDSNLSTPIMSKVYSDKRSKTVVYTSEKTSVKKISKFKSRGIEVVSVASKNDHLNLNEILKDLYVSRGISSVMVEGGREIFSSFIKEKLVDKLIWIVANRVIGGENSINALSEIGVSKLNQAFTLNELSAIKIGDDTVFEGYL